MFTRPELIAKLPQLANTTSPPLEVVEFGNQDFDVPASEQYIWAIRGSKQDFADGLLFWIKSVEAQGWEGRESFFAPYAEGGLCEPITEVEFSSLITGYSGGLQPKLPPFLLEFAGFQWALRMYADWDDVGVMAELAEAFVAFYWSTTA